MSFPIENGDFPIVMLVSLPEGNFFSPFSSRNDAIFRDILLIEVFDMACLGP